MCSSTSFRPVHSHDTNLSYSRGGRGDFKWEDVKDDQHRENYLGHSLMARKFVDCFIARCPRTLTLYDTQLWDDGKGTKTYHGMLKVTILRLLKMPLEPARRRSKESKRLNRMRSVPL